jgi:hypothetical protein
MPVGKEELIAAVRESIRQSSEKSDGAPAVTKPVIWIVSAFTGGMARVFKRHIDELELKLAELEKRLDEPVAFKSMGQWSPEALYFKGMFVELDGRSWCANATTKDRPGTSPDWLEGPVTAESPCCKPEAKP